MAVPICLGIFLIGTAFGRWSFFLLTCPWRCTKKFMIMSLLIPGPKSPDNSLDVYLWLLIDELINLWKKWCANVRQIYGEMFTLRAVVIWKINGFLVYGMWSS